MKLEHSSMETIWMSQKAAAMGYWWLAVSSGRHTHSCIMSCAVFCGTSNYPGDPALLQPRFHAPSILAFPQTKITFENEEISDCQWDSGRYDGAADGDWGNCVRSQGPYFDGDWGIIVLCTMFLVSYIFLHKCLYFSNYMTGYLLDRPPTSSRWGSFLHQCQYPGCHIVRYFCKKLL